MLIRQLCITLLACLTWILGDPVPTAAQRTFGIDDLERVRQPYNASLSPDGKWISYVLGDTLWVIAARGDSESRPVSAGMSNQINFDQPFQAWSPDGKRLVYRAGSGGVSGQGTLSVYDAETGSSAPLLPEKYAKRLQTFLHWMASGPAWNPDGTSVAFLAADTSESPRHLGLYEVDVRRRSVRLLAVDTAGPVGGIASAAWSPDGRWLAYGSGAFLGSDGKLVLRRSDRAEEVILKSGAPMYRLINWSPDGQFLSVLPHNERRVLLRIDNRGVASVVSEAVPFVNHAWIADGQLIGLQHQSMSSALAVWSPGEQVPTPIESEEGVLFSLVGTAISGPSTLVAYTMEAGDLPLDVWTAQLGRPEAARLQAVARITHANRWLDSLVIARAGTHNWTGPAGDTLEAQLFLPPNGVAEPPYPLVVRPYGGYSNEFPKSEYFMDAGTQLLAAAGWGVALPNTRGMSSQPPTGRYGEVQLEDTRALIEDLVARGVVDGRRVAVIGHSHGGALAYYYLTQDAGFCAVVAVNGWSDWSEIAARLRASEEDLPARLERVSPILNAKSATAPLLAVSGAGDTQVPPENAQRMVEALLGIGKPAELLHFNDEGHLLTHPDNRRSFWQRALDFLGESCEGRLP